MKRLAALLFLVASCGRTWDFGQPFALSVDTDQIPAAQAHAAFASAISQLGGQVSAGAAQVVHIIWDADCRCASCTSKTAAHTERLSQDTIQICPWYRKEPTDGLTDNITHELGHVLGRWEHLDCSTGAMMTPSYNCRQDHARYQPLDLSALCGAGGMMGGVCGR